VVNVTAITITNVGERIAARKIDRLKKSGWFFGTFCRLRLSTLLKSWFFAGVAMKKYYLALGATLLVAALDFGGALSWVRLHAFSLPAGWLVGLATGGSLELTREAAVVHCAKLNIVLSPSCAGFAFFLILCLSALIARREKFRFSLFPAAYFTAVGVNALRILCVSAWETGMEKRFPLPHVLQHQVVGMCVFLLFLMMFYAVLISADLKGDPRNDGSCKS